MSTPADAPVLHQVRYDLAFGHTHKRPSNAFMSNLPLKT